MLLPSLRNFAVFGIASALVFGCFLKLLGVLMAPERCSPSASEISSVVFSTTTMSLIDISLLVSLSLIVRVGLDVIRFSPCKLVVAKKRRLVQILRLNK